MRLLAALVHSVRRFRPARLLAGLLLLAAVLQATAPAYSPLEAARGSAFSASTADVALAPARQPDAARHAPLPVPPLAGTAAQVPLSRTATALPTVVARPDPTGPPAARPRSTLPEPRAPPLA